MEDDAHNWEVLDSEDDAFYEGDDEKSTDSDVDGTHALEEAHPTVSDDSGGDDKDRAEREDPDRVV
ncbi:hypothetical protein T484DRAFT_1860904 [Baffinella frigidus]|nr:hypothetical protein T484DRAFT_1860904 [Cryptophyta sp. CCMP2293]